MIRFLWYILLLGLCCSASCTRLHHTSGDLDSKLGSCLASGILITVPEFVVCFSN
jgi:hypothetical protein